MRVLQKINKKLSRSFIQMCIDISTKTDDNEMFLHIEPVLAELNQVMRASTASIILHCLKPYTFPILNNNIGYEDVYKALDIQLMRKSNVDTYIQNCRKIKEFRDANLPFRNYQIFYLENRKLRENFNPIVEIISKYKADFVIRDKEEGYKWGAIKCFQDNWDIDADDFAGMLERALAKTSNLLASQAIKKGISHDRLEHYQIQ